MFHVLLSCISVCLCMWGFQKENIGKKVARSTKVAKKVDVYKKAIYFPESVFPGVTGNILKNYVDLIVTQDSADHFASHETLKVPNKLLR